MCVLGRLELSLAVGCGICWARAGLWPLACLVLWPQGALLAQQLVPQGISVLCAAVLHRYCSKTLQMLENRSREAGKGGRCLAPLWWLSCCVGAGEVAELRESVRDRARTGTALRRRRGRGSAVTDRSSVFVLQAVKGRAFPWRLSCSASGCWPSPRAGRCTPASTPSTSLWLQVRAVLGTKPPTSAFINQASRPTERFSCGLEKKKIHVILIYFLLSYRYPPALHLQPETEAWRLKSSGVDMEMLFPESPASL